MKKVTTNSREVKPGDVFVAIRGTRVDGHDYIHEALKNGAERVIGERDLSGDPMITTKNYVRVSDSSNAYSEECAKFFHHPSHSLMTIGVTGTSGKTTSAYLIHSILSEAGLKPGLIGTIEHKIGDRVIESSHTTPDAWEVQRLIAQMRDEVCRSVVMEVSSHALKQKRVEHVEFDGAVFTNLSREHLDYHPDMDDYFESKKILFTRLFESSKRLGKNPQAAIPNDQKYGSRLIQELGGKNTHPIHWDHAKVDQFSVDGLEFTYRGLNIQSSLFGRFNLENILGAVEISLALKIPQHAIIAGVKNLKSVPGRLETVRSQSGAYCIVDYAHKSDAMEKVLKALQEVKGTGKIITVFGCGGNRDRTKRPVMGKIATENSDWVWITSDNPRLEDPQAIIDEILVGIPKTSKNFNVEVDRRRAIEAAVRSAKSGDCVAILGKGHEAYQLIPDPSNPGELKKISFDDREIARQA